MNEMKKDYIVILIPMKSEFDSFFNNFVNDTKKRRIGKIIGREFTYDDNLYFACECGVGRANSAYTLGALSSLIDIRFIINLGTAGSLCGSVKPYDIVIASDVAYLDVDLTAFGYEYGQMSQCPQRFKCLTGGIRDYETEGIKVHSGLILTSDSFLTQESYLIKKLGQYSFPLAIDMEGCALAQIAYKLDIPITIIRSISDVVYNENNSKTHDEMVTKTMTKMADLVKNIIKVII